MRRLLETLGVRRDEGKPTLLLFVGFFLIVAAIITGKTARDTFFLARFGRTYLPLMFVAQALVVTAAVPLLARFSRGRHPSRTLFLGAVISAAPLALARWHAEGYVIPVAYVAVEVATVVVTTQFWLLTGGVFHSRQAKRLFALIASGGSFAGIVVGIGAPTLDRGWPRSGVAVRRVCGALRGRSRRWGVCSGDFHREGRLRRQCRCV